MNSEGVSVVLNERPEFKAIVDSINEAASLEAKERFDGLVRRFGGIFLGFILGNSFSESELRLPEDWDPRGIVSGRGGLKKLRDALLEGVLPKTKDLILDVIWVAYVDSVMPGNRKFQNAFYKAKSDMYESWTAGEIWNPITPHEDLLSAAVASDLSTYVRWHVVPNAIPSERLQVLVFDPENSLYVKQLLRDGSDPEELQQELDRFQKEFLAAFFKRLKGGIYFTTDPDTNLTTALELTVQERRSAAAAAKKELLSYARKGGARLSGAEDWDPRKSSGDRADVISQLKRFLSGEGLLGDASIYEDAGFPIGILMKGKLLKLFTEDTRAAYRFREGFRAFLASLGTGMKYMRLDLLNHIIEIVPISGSGKSPRLSGAEDWGPRRGKLNARGLFGAIHKWIVKRYGTNGRDVADLMLLEVLPPDLWEGATLAIKQRGQLYDIIVRDDHEHHASWLELMDRLGYEVHEKYAFEFFFYPVDAQG